MRRCASPGKRPRVRSRLGSLQLRGIRLPRTRAVRSPWSSFGPSPPLRRHTALGRQDRPDRASPGRSRTRRLRAAVTRSRLRLRPHRNRLLLLHHHHRLRLLHRQVRRPLHRPRRLRSAVRRSRAGARATGTMCIPGLPATHGASPKATERRRAVGRRASSRVGAGRSGSTTRTMGTRTTRAARSSTGTATRVMATATKAAATATTTSPRV